ncbi:hypothetical protein B0A55_00153 [Friedmanniomyces simplex]|uniref:t-SNARE coiled-coil homology domain-containing protein n=1 Tax=Friedmanniomyces simplex TaxID=329884 RepID=A0A4U0Y5G2_9PEZI|nr:hypothetical protein B0A55_00153 [Friedmanniomyces simplex]
MPFGLKKSDKSGDGDLDKQKSSLFGSKNKASKSPAPPSGNPYAVPSPANDPYARPNANPYATQNGANDPYAPKSQTSFSQPPTSSFGSLTLNSEHGAPPSYDRASPAPNRYEKTPVPQGGYGGGAPRYQNQGSYGQTNGYGSDPYGAGSGPSQSRAGGYGGLGRTNSRDTVTTDVGRQALFGDAPQRAQQTQQPGAPAAQEQGGDASYGNAAGGYGSSQTSGAYGYGEERELTAEELEDQEVEATKGEIRDIKRSDVATTRNAMRIAEQIEQTGRDTLARLGRQGDMLHNAEGHLDRAKFENLKAEEKAKELKTLNRSMFAVHVGNPFTKEKRLEKDIQRELEKRQHERETMQTTREAAYGSEQRKQQAAKDLRGNVLQSAGAPKRSLADRSKFQFEADSDDDQMEDEIEDNLDGLHNAAKTINKIGRAMGEELTSQNAHLDRISGKTDKVDDQIAMNRARLDRIK